MDLGIGRGDSSRRVLGKRPTTLAQLEEAALAIRALARGEPVTLHNQEVRLPWAGGPPEHPHGLPIWIAAYGPKALHLTGQIADGVILQFADPSLIRWSLQFLHAGARAAGRDPASIKVMAAAPRCGSRTTCRRRARRSGCAGSRRWSPTTWWTCSRATTGRAAA